MKVFKRLVSCVMIILLIVSFGGCTKESNGNNSDFYIKVNSEYLSKEYISYFFYIAENEMLAEAGYASEMATDEDIATYWSTAEIDGKNAVDVARDLAVSNAIQQKLQYHKAISEGISLTKEEKNEISEILSNASESKGGDETFEAVLSEAGTDIDSYKQILTENEFIQKLFDKYDSDGKLSVSDSELASFMELNDGSVNDDECISYLKIQKFNKMADEWKEDSAIEINDKKMLEITVAIQ